MAWILNAPKRNVVKKAARNCSNAKNASKDQGAILANKRRSTVAIVPRDGAWGAIIAIVERNDADASQRRPAHLAQRDRKKDAKTATPCPKNAVQIVSSPLQFYPSFHINLQTSFRLLRLSTAFAPARFHGTKVCDWGDSGGTITYGSLFSEVPLWTESYRIFLVPG